MPSKTSASPPAGLRQLLVLTPEEKRTIAFVLVMLVLGLATARYRAGHSAPPSRTAVHEVATATARPAQKRAEAKRPRLPR